MTFQTWLKENYPQYRGDVYSLEEDPKENIPEALEAAYDFGFHSRDEEVSKLIAHTEGLRLALQDKVQIHHHVTQKKRWWQR